MLQQHILSFVLRLVPESLLILYAIYRFTNTKPIIKKLFVTSIIASIGAYLIRLLPIHFGVHTILALMLYILLVIRIHKIEMYKAIASSIISVILLFVSDILALVIYNNVLNISSDVLLGQSLIATISGIPSLFIYFFIIQVITFIKEKRIFYEKHSEDFKNNS